MVCAEMKRPNQVMGDKHNLKNLIITLTEERVKSQISLMDDSGQEHQPKQGQEAKNDTSIKENKNKTQTINDETACQIPIVRKSSLY